MLKSLVFFLAIVLLLAGCDIKPDTCREQSSWALRVGFYRVDTTGGVITPKDSALRYILINSDNSILDSSGLAKVSLGLYQSRDTTKFSITLNAWRSATLYAVYQHERVFENYKCGFRTNFFLDTIYTVPKICDSIIIVYPNITDVYQENCRFYLNRDSTVKY